MTEEQTIPQLTFEIDSAGAANTIYVTADASVNDITLTIGTTTTATFVPASEVVEPSRAETADGSLLYLDLTPLDLTQGEFDAISPQAKGWQVVKFPDDHVLGMTPDAGVAIAPGEAAKIEIGALAASRAKGASASFTVMVYRVTGITVGDIAFPTTFSVALAALPGGGDPLDDDLVVELVTSDVVSSVPEYDPVLNQLAFAFVPGRIGRPVYPGEDTHFTLSFVYATDPSGYGALCTPDQVKPPFEVVAGTNAEGWTITPNRSQQSPSWTLWPPAERPIVGRGVYATVSILVNNLVTSFQPGPTIALMSYQGVPGYADGVFTMLITKRPHVRINSLTVQPNPVILEDGKARVKIGWTVQNAGTMILAPFQVNVTGKSSYTATITETTQITLTAQGTHLASMGNVALSNTTAEVLPVINSFEAVPRSVYAGDVPRYVALRWNVNTNEQLELLSSAGPPDPTRYAKVGEVSKPVSGPQMYTLRPRGKPGGHVVERSIIVSVFAPQTRSWPVQALHLAAPPNASFVAASDGETVMAVDTMVYQPVSGEIPVGERPAGMVFSAKGDILYVANSGGGTVSAIAVAATGSEPQYRFTETAQIPVGGSPRRLALSPDGTYLYVTVDRGAEPGLLAVLSTGARPGLVTAVETGVGPRGVAVTPSGAQVFVADAGDSTVTVVGRAPGGQHSYAGVVSGIDSASDVAVTPDGGVLLVTCPPLGAVLALNAVHLEAGRQILKVGASPWQLALVPGGAYAAVACAGDDTVALLAVGGTPAECRVAATGIEVGQTPEAVAVTPDSGLVLAGAGSAGLAVITLAEYQTAQQTPDIGGQPTDVTISPDGTTVTAWHNARKTFSVGTPSTGLFVYDIGSQTVTRQLATVPVVAAVFHPVAGHHSAFLAEDEKQAVTVLDTATWEVTDTINLAGQTTGLPVALAAAADASTLFVLVRDQNTRKCELLVYRVGSWTAPEGKVELLTAKPGSAQTLAVAADGSRAYVTDQGSGHLLVAERGPGGSYALTGSPVNVGEYPIATALSPDGSRLFVADDGNGNGLLAEVDTAALTVRSVVLPSKGYTTLTALAVSPDGSRLLATDQTMPAVRIFDAASLRLVQTISWKSGVRMPGGIAVARDGSRIFTANIISGNLGIISQVQAAPTAAQVSVGPGLAPFAEPYRGLFMRDYVGQTPDSPRSRELTNCTDIWPAGTDPLPKPEQTLVGGYMETAPNVLYYGSGSGQLNYIYVRGMSTIEGESKARVWLYYLDGLGDPTLILWPPLWRTDGMRALNEPVGYVEVPLPKLRDICFTSPPFIFNLRDRASGHYCVVAVVENPPLSNPPVDPRGSLGSIGRMDQLAAFISNNRNLGWKNTMQKKTEAHATWQQLLKLEGPKQGGIFHAGLQFSDLGIDPEEPPDSYFSFTIVGPNGKPRGMAKTALTDSNPVFMVTLDWTGYDNYKTDFQMQYWAGAKGLPQGAKITAVVGVESAELTGLVRDPLAGAFRARVFRGDRVEDGFDYKLLRLAGSVRINLR